MGNKKKQTNEFDNYFDDDFEVVYEDLEDLGSYLSEDSSDNNNDYRPIMTVIDATPTIMMMMTTMIMMTMTIMMTIMIITATAEIQKRKSATTNRIRIPKNPRRKSVADCPM